jgi:nucleoside-diphosphate-sugar epimerase
VPIDAPSHVADITDLDAIAPAFAGVESVVHLAAESSPQADWPDLLGPNVIGLRNVFEAARRAGVGQLVYASSTHVVAGHERAAAPQIYELDDERVFGTAEIRPDSLYGATKAFGEALGRWYADEHGLHVICLRIGWVWDGPDDEFMARRDQHRLTAEQRAFRRRSRAIWLSQRDCGQLFRRALTAHDLRWAVVYGTSDNPRQIWDLEPTRRLLGFAPQDRAPT